MPEDEGSTIAEQWSRDRLMGKSVSFKGIPPEDLSDGANGDKQKRRRSSIKASEKEIKIDPMLWGQPGHLTDSEADTYFRFKEEVERRGGDFKSTIYCFGEEEGEVWALCRWLRARKFIFEDVVAMIEEATQTRAEAKTKEFYPNPVDALGCDISLYFAQYPQLYSGFAKNGAPLFISKPGVLNVDAVECLTTLDGIVKFHWYIMMYDFASRLRDQKKKDSHFKRFECVCILDLEHLAMSQLTNRALQIVKEQSAIDSICFPETMSKMFIINGARFFGASWSLIKGWLDPRTAGKIEVISDRKKWTQRLLEHVDADQLPVDYGGMGPNTVETLAKENVGGVTRLHSEVMYLRGHGSVSHDIQAGETVSVSIWTRSPSGATFSVVDADKKRPSAFVDGVLVKHSGTGDTSETPSSKIITSDIVGPAKLKVKADSAGSRWSSSNFLVVFTVS